MWLMLCVELSNQSMVSNMKQVIDIMAEMRESVGYSENTTITMMSKYEETAVNITKIESTVGHLVEELGEGGFMNIDDIKEGMHVEVFCQESKKGFKTKVSRVVNSEIYVEAGTTENQFFGEKGKYLCRWLSVVQSTEENTL